jgi:CrcB protein
VIAVLLVALGGAIGAPLRYHLDRLVQRSHDTVFPWGTLTVNVVGCFVLGLLAQLSSGYVYDLLGVGFCGALTTYSTFGYETVRLLEGGSRLYALANVLMSLLAGLGAALLGIGVGTALG